MALKYLNVNFEHWRTCEWAIKSIQAYKDIHFTNENMDYSKELNKEEIIDYLYKKGISSNYNEPMKIEQIQRINEKDLRKIYNNIIINKNMVNIQQVKGEDLEIINTNEYEYIMTYSFPCQDLSNAGLKKGMSDTTTRSGMLWEVERILKECKQIGELPQILLMENVPQVHGIENMEDFYKWQLSLQELGYKNYWQDLIATDYGIPQTRNRCFMISILGDYSYNFPMTMPLKLKLKDLLENNVDEKYYLSDKKIQYFLKHEQEQINKGNGFRWNISEGEKPAKTLTTSSGRMEETYIGNEALIKTLKQNENKKFKIGSIYQDKKAKSQGGSIYSKENSSLTLTTSSNEIGVCVGTYQYSKSDKFMNRKDRLQLGKEVADTLQTTQKKGIVNSELRIRKLTPKECFRLMGVKDEDFENVRKKQSDNSLYHLAGDSIVVNVLMAIFKELL